MIRKCDHISPESQDHSLFMRPFLIYSFSGKTIDFFKICEAVGRIADSPKNKRKRSLVSSMAAEGMWSSEFCLRRTLS